jgi:small subunit ribosomal protein S21
MIIIKIENKTNLESGLKQLKNKVIKTKQAKNLLSRKEYKKKSVERREEIKKAIYKEKLNKLK